MHGKSRAAAAFFLYTETPKKSEDAMGVSTPIIPSV